MPICCKYADLEHFHTCSLHCISSRAKLLVDPTACHHNPWVLSHFVFRYLALDAIFLFPFSGSTHVFVLPKLPQSCSIWQIPYWSCFLHYNAASTKTCFEIWIISRFLLNWNRSFCSLSVALRFTCPSAIPFTEYFTRKKEYPPYMLWIPTWLFVSSLRLDPFFFVARSKSTKRSLNRRSIDQRNKSVPKFKQTKDGPLLRRVKQQLKCCRRFFFILNPSFRPALKSTGFLAHSKPFTPIRFPTNQRGTSYRYWEPSRRVVSSRTSSAARGGKTRGAGFPPHHLNAERTLFELVAHSMLFF